MKKVKLTTELINNASDFYSENLGKTFSNTEYQNISSKLQEIIEYDHIVKNKRLPYNLPQYTLYIIYFIGEYKKAYQYAQQDKQHKDKNTLESLGKGFANKEKEYEKGLKKVLDKSIDIDDRLKEFFKTLILFLVKKHSYKKISMFFVGTIYTTFPLIRIKLDSIHQFNSFMQMSLNAMEYTLKYFQYTHLAEDKILNSALISIYTVLTQNLKMDEANAFKYSKELVNSFIDNKDYITDKYRKEYLTDKDIYYAGIYQGMPIFQWYISSQNKSYFNDKDVKKFKALKRALFSEKSLDLNTTFIAISMLKVFDKKASTNDLNNVLASLNSDSGIKATLLSSHKQFVNAPFTLFQYLPKPRKSLILLTISLFIGFYTKFANLKTKFSRK